MRGSYVDNTQPNVVEGVAGLKNGRKKPPLLYVYRVVTIELMLVRFVMLKASPISSSRTRSPSGTLFVMRVSTLMNSGPRMVLRPMPGDLSLARLESRFGSCVVISLNARPDCADSRRLTCQPFRMPFSTGFVTELA